MKSIVIIDPKGVISSGGLDVIKRHANYSQLLKSHSNGEVNLVVVSNSAPINEISSSNLKMYSTNTSRVNFFKYIKRTKKILHDNKIETFLLVAGDPWESAWCAALIRKEFLNRKTPIEVQAHGDFAEKNWKYLSFINLIRYTLISIGLRIAYSIRVTSEQQKSNFNEKFQVPRNKMIVIPVFMDLKKLHRDTEQPRKMSIGLVGRLHFDRGLKDFVKLLKKLTKNNRGITVFVAGDGPKLNWFKRKTKDLGKQNKVYFLGNLDVDELQRFWEKIGVLISVAPLESFGRAMREAIVSGVPVWAIRSTGSLELHKQLNGQGIYFIDQNKDYRALHNELETILKFHIPKQLISELINSDELNLIQLIENWLSSVRAVD
jgi:glycosyltransferase involved in cell wall biosynthesis